MAVVAVVGKKTIPTLLDYTYLVPTLFTLGSLYNIYTIVWILISIISVIMSSLRSKMELQTL